MPPPSSTDPFPKLYRPCVGLALFNKKGHVFVGERIDNPGAWQMPQGGIDEGEDIQNAALRELREEIGTSKAAIIKIAREKIRYDLPHALSQKLWGGKYAGQEQSWVALKFLGADSDINIHADERPEFQNWRWVNLQDTLKIIVPFKRDTYKRVVELFKDIPETLKG